MAALRKPPRRADGDRRRARPARRVPRLTKAAALAALLAAAGCIHHAAPPERAGLTPAPPTAAELPPPDAIPGTFTLRQKLTATSPKGGGSFEAVLQKTPGTLTLVGLTPYGSRAFLLQQTKGDVQFTKYIPRELPFPPTFMLLDIHRVLDQLARPAPARRRALGPGRRRDHPRALAGRQAGRTHVHEREGTTARHDHDQLRGLRCVELRHAHHTPKCPPGLPGRHRDGAIPVTSCCKFCRSRVRVAFPGHRLRRSQRPREPPPGTSIAAPARRADGPRRLPARAAVRDAHRRDARRRRRRCRRR